MAEQLAAPIRVLLIASYGIVLFGLTKLIEGQSPKRKVVGTFTDCANIFPQLEKLSPDEIMIDLDHEPIEGIKAIHQLFRSCRAKIIVFSGLEDHTVCNRAMLAGAKGLVGKKEALETIPKALEKVNEGQLWLDRTDMGKLIHDLADKRTVEHVDPDKVKIRALTARERTVVGAVTSHAEAPCKVVAEMLHISERTLRKSPKFDLRKIWSSEPAGALGQRPCPWVGQDSSLRGLPYSVSFYPHPGFAVMACFG